MPSIHFTHFTAMLKSPCTIKKKHQNFKSSSYNCGKLCFPSSCIFCHITTHKKSSGILMLFVSQKTTSFNEAQLYAHYTNTRTSTPVAQEKDTCKRKQIHHPNHQKINTKNNNNKVSKESDNNLHLSKSGSTPH